MKYACTLIMGAMITLPAMAQNEIDRWSAVVWKSPDGGVFKYRVRAPGKVEKDKQYPLLVFLHGAGGRGDDNKKQLFDAGALPVFDKQGVFSRHAGYVIAGQVPQGQKWVDVDWGSREHRMPKASHSMRMQLESLDAFIADKKNRVDPKRIYVMGLSMGGYGTWDAIQRRPDFFAAAVPICGGGDKILGKAIAGVPVWAWHGDKDGVIVPDRSRDMIAAIKAAGGKPKYTEVKGRGHGVWGDVWRNAEVWDWLFEQRRKP